MANLMNLYEAVANAETGGEENPWIRTKFQPKGGSSAFGPVQITHGLITDAINRKQLTPDSAKFATEVMLPMQSDFLKYGGSDMKPGYEIYDYGQSGGFDVDQYGDAYKQLASELMQMKLDEARGDVNKFLMLWRGTEPESGYKKRFESKYKRSHYKKD